jgi:hypothetical protein
MTTGTYDDRVPGARPYYPAASNEILAMLFNHGIKASVVSDGGPGCRAISVRTVLLDGQVIEYLITDGEADLPVEGDDLICQVYDGETRANLGQVYAAVINPYRLYLAIRSDIDARQRAAETPNPHWAVDKVLAEQEATRALLAEYRDWKDAQSKPHDGVSQVVLGLALLDRFAAALEEATA